MKNITITVPDNCKLKQDGNTYTIVEKEKKLTYKDVARELFATKPCFYIDTLGKIVEVKGLAVSVVEQLNNCTSRRQAEKLLAINKLMTVAKYLNDGWQPDWGNVNEIKYTIACDYINNSFINDITCMTYNWGIIYFKSRELAKKAIEILGEETIKLALCTDY